MARSISRTGKRGRGRPRTNPTSIHLTLVPDQLAEVDDWIDAQFTEMSRPEAIRVLVELGLAYGRPSQIDTERTSAEAIRQVTKEAGSKKRKA